MFPAVVIMKSDQCSFLVFVPFPANTTLAGASISGLSLIMLNFSIYYVNNSIVLFVG
uniref:Uncharacterized protein n=1 Tax=Arundo donax TaxID=35708 RepID=A0A0A8YJP9_ARUDO